MVMMAVDDVIQQPASAYKLTDLPLSGSYSIERKLLDSFEENPAELLKSHELVQKMEEGLKICYSASEPVDSCERYQLDFGKDPQTWEKLKVAVMKMDTVEQQLPSTCKAIKLSCWEICKTFVKKALVSSGNYLAGLILKYLWQSSEAVQILEAGIKIYMTSKSVVSCERCKLDPQMNTSMSEASPIQRDTRHIQRDYCCKCEQLGSNMKNISISSWKNSAALIKWYTLLVPSYCNWTLIQCVKYQSFSAFIDDLINPVSWLSKKLSFKNCELPVFVFRQEHSSVLLTENIHTDSFMTSWQRHDKRIVLWTEKVVHCDWFSLTKWETLAAKSVHGGLIDTVTNLFDTQEFLYPVTVFNQFDHLFCDKTVSCAFLPIHLTKSSRSFTPVQENTDVNRGCVFKTKQKDAADAQKPQLKCAGHSIDLGSLRRDKTVNATSEKDDLKTRLRQNTCLPEETKYRQEILVCPVGKNDNTDRNNRGTSDLLDSAEFSYHPCDTAGLSSTDSHTEDTNRSNTQLDGYHSGLSSGKAAAIKHNANVQLKFPENPERDNSKKEESQFNTSLKSDDHIPDGACGASVTQSSSGKPLAEESCEEETVHRECGLNCEIEPNNLDNGGEETNVTESVPITVVEPQQYREVFPPPAVDETELQRFEPLLDIVDKLANGERVPPQITMKYEMLRFCTLRSYPKENKPYITRLAQAGFYYANNKDEVVCYCCAKRKSGWTENDVPLDVHRRLSPQCKFLLNNSEVNVTIEKQEKLAKRRLASRRYLSSALTSTAAAQTRSPGQLTNGILSAMANNSASTAVSGVLTSLKFTPQTSTRSSLLQTLRGCDLATVQTTCIDSAANRSYGNFSGGSMFGFTQSSVASSNAGLITSSVASNTAFSSGGLMATSVTGSSSRSSTFGQPVASSVAEAIPSSLASQLPMNTGPLRSFPSSIANSCTVSTLAGSMTNTTTTTATTSSTSTGIPASVPSSPSPPKYPAYNSAAVRLTSFRECSEVLVAKERLAEAGFFYAGFGDCCRCFQCGVGLRHWSAEDDPWIEHSRWSRNCSFVKEKKGEEFVNLVQMAVTYQENQQQQQQQQQQQNSASGENLQNGELVESLLHTDAAQSVLEMGYTPDVIRRSIRAIIESTGQSQITAAMLMEKIFDFEELSTPGESSNAASASTANSDIHRAQTSDQSGRSLETTPSSTTANMASCEGAPMSMPAQAGRPFSTKREQLIKQKKLKEENERMKYQSICTKCKQRDVCIVFLPCGHLVTCEQCAETIKYCNVQNCGKYIKGTVRTYVA